MATKQVIGNLTEEQKKKLIDIKNIEKGIKEMQSYLLEEMVGCKECEQELWNEVRAKYTIDIPMQINHQTGEITVA